MDKIVEEELDSSSRSRGGRTLLNTMDPLAVQKRLMKVYSRANSQSYEMSRKFYIEILVLRSYTNIQ